MIAVSTYKGKTATCKVIIKDGYSEAGLDEFAIGETKTFYFGSTEIKDTINVKASTLYSKESKYGWKNTASILLTDGENFVSGNNVRNISGTNVIYDYPTFQFDLPVGFYEVTIVQGSDTSDTVNGAYVEGNTYAVRWSTEGFSTLFTEPSKSSYIVTPKGSSRESKVLTAVADGSLTIQLATSLDDSGTSGTVAVRSISVTRVASNVEESKDPTLRFIGDSTVASYPPEDGNVWTPIPERTGWGSDFAMARFMSNEVVLVNKAVAGSSIKSYLADGYYNDFFLTARPGDTVIIEGGINDSAAGRRFVDAAAYEAYLRYYIESCQTFGLDVVLSSGTSSGITYTEVMAKLASEYELTYIDLLGEYNTYKNKLIPTAQGDLTVDGTHLSRVGAVLAAQIVSSRLAQIDGVSISGLVKPQDINSNAPTAKVTGVSVKAQTSNSVTLSWNMDEETLYQPDQLITRFNIYRKDKGAADSTYKQVGQARAYVSASMTAPKLQTTIESPVTGDYDYAVSVVGLVGEGSKSDSIIVKEFKPDTTYQILELIEKYQEQMYDSTHYTAESYMNLMVALNTSKTLLGNGATEVELVEALATVKTAVAGLKRVSQVIMEENFENEAIGSKWGTAGHQLLSVIMKEDGNRLANAYVEAAGTRQIKKEITGIASELLSIEFEWYPGQPDRRNCTEIQFGDAKGVYFSLKTSNNGHIGYVVGAYDPNSTAYLTGDGFHAENTIATDCGLSNEVWYNVRIVFNYKTHTAALYLIPRDDENLPSKVVSGIQISQDASQVTFMNFLCMRGKQDNDTSNDLSVLWDTYLDNLAIYYETSKQEVNLESLNAAKDSYLSKVSNIAPDALRAEEFTKADLSIKHMENNVGFITQEDVNFLEIVIKNAELQLPK